MDNVYGAWEREHSLHFKHVEYGDLQRNEHSEWEQIHPEDGRRVLKSESLKDAFVDAEKPYKKQKIKVTKTVTAKPKIEKPEKEKKQVIKKTSKKKKKN